MIKYFFTVSLVAVVSINNTAAQYYHKDILSVKQSFADKSILQDQKIKTVIVHSFEADGSTSEGFFCQKKISKNYKLVETFTRSYMTGKSLQSAFYNEKGMLIKSIDSSEINAVTTVYEYDEKDNVITITSYNHSSDEDYTTAVKEVHAYTYNLKSKPVKMLRIRNDTDTTLIDFVIDEKNNVTDEIEKTPNGKHYYYYYDSKNRLTDIVKFNVVKNSLVPDFIFEYDYEGQLTQMVSVEEGISGDYFTWKYTYLDGLRIIEKCFSKDKKLLGYFEYEYK